MTAANTAVCFIAKNWFYSTGPSKPPGWALCGGIAQPSREPWQWAPEYRACCLVSTGTQTVVIPTVQPGLGALGRVALTPRAEHSAQDQRLHEDSNCMWLGYPEAAYYVHQDVTCFKRERERDDI